MCETCIVLVLHSCRKIARIQRYLTDIPEWLLKNMLKNNGNKTGLSIHGTPQQVSKHKEITLDRKSVFQKSEVQNLVVIFYTGFAMKPHCKAISKRAHHHLYNINIIWESLTEEATSAHIQASLSSSLGNSNALLYGLHKITIFPLNVYKTLQPAPSQGLNQVNMWHLYMTYTGVQ